jgi:hypothetical protein
MSTQSLTHLWASRKKEYGKSGNVEFRGDTIYSYGWWPMAKWHYAKGDVPYIIMTNWSYSSSTGKHLSHVRSAIPGDVHVFYSGEVETSYATYRRSPDLTPRAAMKTMLQNMANYYTDFFNPKKYLSERSVLPLARQQHSKAIYNHLKILCDFADLPWNEDADKYLISDHEVRIMEVMLMPYRQRINERMAERERKQKLIDAAFVEAQRKYLVDPVEQAKRWMRGEVSLAFIYGYGSRVDLPEDDQYRILTGNETMRQDMATAMRIEGDHVVTNHRASVPLSSAHRLWNIMKTGRPVHGVEVGLYTVRSWNGELVIGCHRIPREIVEYFVELYNW